MEALDAVYRLGGGREGGGVGGEVGTTVSPAAEPTPTQTIKYWQCLISRKIDICIVTGWLTPLYQIDIF